MLEITLILISVLLIIAGVYSLIKYKKTKKNKYLYIGLALTLIFIGIVVFIFIIYSQSTMVTPYAPADQM